MLVVVVSEKGWCCEKRDALLKWGYAGAACHGGTVSTYNNIRGADAVFVYNSYTKDSLYLVTNRSTRFCSSRPIHHTIL